MNGYIEMQLLGSPLHHKTATQYYLGRTLLCKFALKQMQTTQHLVAKFPGHKQSSTCIVYSQACHA